MSTWTHGGVVLGSLLIVAAACAENDGAAPPLRLAMELTDGSRVIGVPAVASVPVQTSYGKMDVPFQRIARITVEDDHETVSVDMQNGDKLTGTVNLRSIELETIFGRASVGMQHVKSIRVHEADGLPAAVKKGLILYYSFNKEQRDTVTDLSGKNNDGKVHGAKWTPKGFSGGAFDFDGATSYINVGYDPKSALFPTQDPILICAWFRTAASEPVQQVIVGTHKAGAGSGYILCVDNSREAGGGRLLWLIMDGTPNGNRLVSKVSVNDGVWHHVAAIWSGDQMLLYVDGVLQGARGAGRTLSYPHQADFRIGHTENINAHGAFDGVYYFKGQIDEVMVFNRSLSESEVKELHDARR